MTGRDLIIHILENNLEDDMIFESGNIPGLITMEEAAIKYNVGLSTIRIWLNLGMLNGVMIGGRLYIPANGKLLIGRGNNR